MPKHLYTFALATFIAGFAVTARAQQLVFSQPHGFYDQPFSLAIAWDDDTPVAGTTIRYTLDGSEPTAKSKAYTGTLSVKGNTIIRAAAIADTGRVTPIATSTYLYTKDVLNQPDFPEGYPEQWGQYTDLTDWWGNRDYATADYGMDPEMTKDGELRPKISQGLRSIPVLSIVTDKDNLFSHENDSVTGGIYIYTGPPVGDGTGHGWTRPASVELFGPDLTGTLEGGQHDFTVNCGLRLHGGHGRLAEKNPKHSFRLVFKEKYGGPKTLKYPLFGPDEPAKFDQLVLRCHFGHSWQHWSEGNREKAQYTRDVWARRIQRKMGHTAVNALYVHLFLNGMYWGLYNIAERVDDQYGKDHLGGKKDDIDVVKIEEDGGNHIEAAEGDLDAWELMTETAKAVEDAAPNDNTAYYRLQGKNAQGEDVDTLEALLDIDNFIDYMLINHYDGNDDWDHHNWYAIRRKGKESQGFRFLCWDSESILLGENDNVLSKDNGRKYPTGIFQNLLNNTKFAKAYLRRAKELLADDGLLGQQSVVAVWDSLYNNIATALYAEAARWGDYRRDVHPWQSQGKLYTVDGTYQKERNRLLSDYFPYRSDYVLSCIENYLNIDDFEIPDGWTELTADMFKLWNSGDADAQPLSDATDVEWRMGQSVGGGTAVIGFTSVGYRQFADLSSYSQLVLRGKGGLLRILANRIVDHGPWKEIDVTLDSSDPYWDETVGCIVVPLDDLKNAPTNQDVERPDDFLHLNAIKVDWSSSATLQAAYLVPNTATDMAMTPTLRFTGAADANAVYTLSGQRVSAPGKGVYIVNGRKVVLR